MLNNLYRCAPLLSAAGEGFAWREHTGKILLTAFLSMVPMFEGRYAVTVAVGMGMPPVFAYLLALITSYLPVPGTGVWMGSAIATLFEMPRGKSALVILAGNAVACLITTLTATGVVALV